MLVALKGGEQRTIAISPQLSVKVPRHFGEYLKSPEKPVWQMRKRVELERLQSLDVYELVHKEALPPQHDGPFNLVWAYDVRPGNITKGESEVYRPRLCVGKVQKGGNDSTDDPVLKFAAQADFTFIRVFLAAMAAKRMYDFEFDIRQFHQNTHIPPDATPIVTTQPRGFEVQGPNGEAAAEMFWVLKKQMQGTRTAGAMADAQLDKLLMDKGGFKRCCGASRRRC